MLRLLLLACCACFLREAGTLYPSTWVFHRVAPAQQLALTFTPLHHFGAPVEVAWDDLPPWLAVTYNATAQTYLLTGTPAEEGSYWLDLWANVSNRTVVLPMELEVGPAPALEQPPQALLNVLERDPLFVILGLLALFLTCFALGWLSTYAFTFCYKGVPGEF